ncbi:MAG: DUF1289 domain-containing protein [Aliifodinibius sp.]|nr:DUF1289 domain-containing protein [Fodinibius sp.]NIV12706.1 DUF1289 domain-containing protein [Fodinibius sp.]NIY26406.1 DUF1289 domain-containing protein [Fodinibius sp.]
MKGKSKSPCVNVCSIDAKTGYCQGCLRTLDEIAMWPQLSETEKERIVLSLEKRKQ